MSSAPLQGKSALVTGGGRRLGREIALSLARAGADVAVTFRTSAAEASETTQRIQVLGRTSFAFQCDVRSEDSVRLAVVSAAEQFGKLDILVNNAGVFETAPLDSISVEQWDTVFETNTRGPFLVAREALPYLKAAHGRIVNIGSLGGIRAWSTHAHYCASKAALHMLTQAMARAFAPEISVNCVAPGWIEMDEEPSEMNQRISARAPMQRSGTAAEVAQAVLFFLAGPDFITGQILAVDGGLGLT